MKKPTVQSLATALASLGMEKIIPRKPGEFTVSEAAEETGMNRQRISERLEKQLKTGVVTRRKLVMDGRAQWLWKLKN